MHAGLLPILHIANDKITNEPAQWQYITLVMEINLKPEPKSHVVYHAIMPLSVALKPDCQ